jgi:hypothetical protein
MNRRINEMLVNPKPVSLSPEELDVEADPITTARSKIRVRAWVRFPGTVVRTEGEAIEWTSKAVHLRWLSADGEERDAWVWANAVEKI